MARRKHLLEEVADAPWWVGIVVAVMVYIGMRYVLPALVPVAQGLSQLAWAFGSLFVLAAIVSVVRQQFRKRLLDQQTSLESIRVLSWQDFEMLIGEAFRRDGYTVEECGGSAPDGGIDLILRKDGKKAVVQCKHWRAMQVGVKPVRELYGIMTAEGADEAIIVSSGEYTQEARAFSDGEPIQLIDGETLIGMIRSVHPAPPIAARVVSDPICPKCARTMVRRTARTGANTGQAFWGCSAYPQCRGTRPIG